MPVSRSTSQRAIPRTSPAKSIPVSLRCFSQSSAAVCVKKTKEGEVTIAYLRDDNSNFYEDGTAAKLDGTEGDVMVDFPEFYYKWVKVDDNKFTYRFAFYNVDGSYKHVPRSLVGAYKAI